VWFLGLCHCGVGVVMRPGDPPPFVGEAIALVFAIIGVFAAIGLIAL
jgi:hypothetical protein